MKPSVSPWAHIVYAMRIVCTNGVVVRIVEYPHDLQISGITYYSDTVYQFTGIQNGTNLTPGSIDLSSMIGISPEITLANIQAGIFDGARVFVFATDWANPVVDQEPIAKCVLGKVKVEDEAYRAECMTLIDLLNSAVGDTHAALCRLKFGGQEFAGCKVDVDSLEVTGTLTSSSSNFLFADSSRGEADDYFGAGEIWFLTGPNAGVAAQRVKDFTGAGGVFEVNEAFPYRPQVGDTYRVRPGCRKRLVDCRDKWDNVPRRGGYDWVPGTRFLNKLGTGGPTS